MDDFDENSVLIDNYLFDNDIDDYDINGTHPIIDGGETDSNDCNIKFELKYSHLQS